MKRLNQYFLITTLIFLIALVFYNCTSTRSVATAEDDSKRRFILRDEGLSQLAFIDLANASANWYVAVPPGRDLQLVGNGRVLIGTGTGYEEREIATGKKMFELTSYPGTLSARRLRNGNTLLAGLDWQGKKGIVLVETDSSGTIKNLASFPEFNYVRLVRETSSGTFLITAGTTGIKVWQALKINPVKLLRTE